MRIRFSCLLVGAAILALGTMAFAQPAIGVSCNGGSPTNVCTITETLYYPGTTANTTATSTQNYTVPTSGNPMGANLIQSNWTAQYTFDNYGFFSTGYTLAGSSLTAYDSSYASENLTLANGNPVYVGYGVKISDQFSLSSVFSGNLILDSHDTISSATNGDNGDTTGLGDYINCDQNNPSPTNGSTDTTGCVYLTSTGGGALESGYLNTSKTGSTAAFTGSGTTNIYEQVTGSVAVSGPTGTGDIPNTSIAASEVVLTFTYDITSTGPTSGTPEPATLLLLGTGLSFVASRLRRKKGEAK